MQVHLSGGLPHPEHTPFLIGKPLGGGLGGFRMVVPTDKRSAMWVRQVARIKLVQ